MNTELNMFFSCWFRHSYSMWIIIYSLSDPSLFANLLRFFFFSELLAANNEDEGEGENDLDTAASRLQQILSIFFQVRGDSYSLKSFFLSLFAHMIHQYEINSN